MVERRLIKEPYFWYAQEVIAGTHNRKGNICCDLIPIFLQYFDLTEFFFSGDTIDEEGNVKEKNEQWGHRN